METTKTPRHEDTKKKITKKKTNGPCLQWRRAQACSAEIAHEVHDVAIPWFFFVASWFRAFVANVLPIVVVVPRNLDRKTTFCC
jgi:hypothetical protein